MYKSVIGNKINKATLSQMTAGGKLPGTFIFEGASGSGKSLIALELAKTILCADREYVKTSGEACGNCTSCRKAGEGVHPDLIVKESEKDTPNSFHIDEIREIIESLWLSPNDSDRKVYILENIQTMTAQAQNALLKSIEEPPPFVYFIITVSDSSRILETVKSRASCFVMDYLDEKNLLSLLTEHGYKEPEAQKAARLADGNAGRALYLAARFSGAESTDEEADDLLGYVRYFLSDTPDNIRGRLGMLNGKPDKLSLISFYTALENALRDVFVIKTFGEECPEIKKRLLYIESSAEADNCKNYLTGEKINFLLKKIHEYRADLEYNIQVKLNITAFLSQIR